MKRLFLEISLGLAFVATFVFAEINISVDVGAGIKPISPYLYGRNIDKISDTKVESDSSEEAFMTQVLEAGIHMMRANTGNNSTRYNWRKKLTVHPDWFNNVYDHDWDITAKKIQDKMPHVDALYGFQLTGYAAGSKDYNFDEWNWNRTHETNANSTLDLAGGGEISEDGQSAIKTGDPSLYNVVWPADSTVGIIPHWRDELKYDMSRFTYWSMDNEMDIWRGTHSDLDLPVTGEFLVNQYINVAKKAKAIWKDIKLTGPVVANEWQWCNISAYNDETRPKEDGREYCWLEYFIKKVAEEQKKSGVKLLDVFDIHWYPPEKDYESHVNWHRVLFDTTYHYRKNPDIYGSGANGVRCASGTCDWSDTNDRSYIFVRINRWLEQYFGKNHGITLAITETDLNADDPMVTALTYASFLGTMQDNDVEIFTPWSWGDGMYEVVHLFSRFGHEYRIESVSSNDSLVSAYSSINNKGDSLTVIFVNRNEKLSENVNLTLKNFKANDGGIKTLTLENLKGETFISHTNNALKTGTVDIKNNETNLSLPPKSITAIFLETKSPKKVGLKSHPMVSKNRFYYENGNWFIDNSLGNIQDIQIFNSLGQNILQINSPAEKQISIKNLKVGNYMIRLKTANGIEFEKIKVH